MIYPMEIRPDRYTDGRPCYVAEYPDLAGCVAYGDTAAEAIGGLAQALGAYTASVAMAGEKMPVPSNARPLGIVWTTGTSAGVNATPAQGVKVSKPRAAAILQTA